MGPKCFMIFLLECTDNYYIYLYSFYCCYSVWDLVLGLVPGVEPGPARPGLLHWSDDGKSDIVCECVNGMNVYMTNHHMTKQFLFLLLLYTYIYEDDYIIYILG